MDYAMDGDLSKFSDLQIATAAGWEGNPQEFVAALIKHRWIDVRKIKPHGKQMQKRNIHDWYDFCGEIIKKRLLRREERQTKSAIIRRSAAEKPPTNRTNRTVPTVPTSTTTGGEYSAAPDKTATALEVELAAVGYKKPDPQLEPERSLACAYRQIRKIPKKAWARWDQEHLAAFKPKARALIDLCGSLIRANDCLHDKAAEFEAKKFKNWTITGVVNNADQWITNHPEEGIDVRTHDRKSVSVPPTERERARNSPGLRGPASAAEILAGVRDLPNVPAASEPKNGAGNRSHE